MSIFWIIVYILFVIFIVTIFSWSTIILLRQKKSWLEFAKKHELAVGKGGFFESVTVDGYYKKKRISLFSQGKVDNTNRGMVRYRTVIEVTFGYGMPGTGAMGNMAAMRVIETLNYGPTHHPDSKEWNKSHLITATDRRFVDAYLTPERLKKINAFFNMPNATAMIVYDPDDAFLRVETIDPMTEVKKIETVIDKLIALADVLKLSDAELDKWSEKNGAFKAERQSQNDPAEITQDVSEEKDQ